MSIRGGRKTIELEAAAQIARDAHARLAEVPEQAADDQKALNAYLQSVIRYMPIVNVLQAQQHELLTEEVADLKAKVRSARPGPDADRVVH